MNSEDIKNLAESLINTGILHNWKFYLLLSLLTLLSSSFAGFVVSYFQKRGETFATKADFEELLRQAKITTKVTEDIKASISHSDWISKEWITLKRIKIEELLKTVFLIKEWISKEREFILLNGEKPAYDNPIATIEVIATLYLPEMLPLIANFVIEANQLTIEIYNTRIELSSNGEKAESGNAKYEEFFSKYNLMYGLFRERIGEIQTACNKALNELIHA